MTSSVTAAGSNLSRDQPRRISAATSTLSRTESVPNVSSRWNVRLMPSARAPVRLGVRDVLAVDARPGPSAGGCSPVMTLNSVVLPAPLGPMSPVT